jgi:hypothetical protein
MKFLADMGISLGTVSWLRNVGYNVVHSPTITYANDSYGALRYRIPSTS